MRVFRPPHLAWNSRLRRCSTAAGEAGAAGTSSGAPTPQHSTSRGNTFDKYPPPRKLNPFQFSARWRYAPLFRTRTLDHFLQTSAEQVVAVATTYRHCEHADITVTLVPLMHAGHPYFYYQVDLLLCQHDSVLMEGRVPFTEAPFSTLVPPRPLPNKLRPVEAEEAPTWEPNDVAAYWQPFSWGVKDSPNYTVIHAADKYDYECLPWYASLRFNLPLVGSFAREKHCLSMIPFLVDNGYKSFAVPWGAAHMPIMHEMLEQNGFRIVSTSTLPIFNAVDGEVSQGFIGSTRRRLRKLQNMKEVAKVLLYSSMAALVLFYESSFSVNGFDMKTGALITDHKK